MAMRCELPLQVDARLLSPGGSDHPVLVTAEADLRLLAQHAGVGNPDTCFLEATLPDGRVIPAQVLPEAGSTQDGVVLLLPPDLAGTISQVTLRLAAVGAINAAENEAREIGVVCSQGPQSVEILARGKQFAVYRYNTTDPDLPRPYFHPIYGPTGVPITQDGEVPGTREKHFHHTGLVLAHQNFTDGNNWQIGPQFSQMRHLAFDVMESGPVLGRFVQRLEWPNVAGDRIVFRETRTVTFLAREKELRYLDVDSTITCGDQPATWNATPYHLLALRVPDAMTVEQGGVITNSEGKKNAETAGASAHWLDFSGPLGGKVCGAALFNHPDNPRSPTPWLNFENETVGAAPTYHEAYDWKPGESLRFRYRLYLHPGDVREGNVEQEYARYVAPIAFRIGAPRPVA